MTRLSLGALLTATSGLACAQPLFDAAPGSGPANQGWIYPAALMNLIPGVTIDAIQTVGPAYTTLDTTPDRNDQIGYFSRLPVGLPNVLPPHPGVGTLDDTTGFRLLFELRIDAEGHNARDDNNDGLMDRAGMSVLVVTNSLDAIEIGFFEGRVWAYEDGVADPGDEFTQAEGFDIDTTGAIRRYELVIHDGAYSLSASGVPLISGLLRDYTGWTPPPSLPVDPYESANLIFIGDDTGSADSRFEIAFIDLAQRCPADLTTQGAASGEPLFGVPDNLVTGADLGYFVNAWVIGDATIADVTSQGAGIGDPLFGVPDTLTTGADLSYFVNRWIEGCP